MASLEDDTLAFSVLHTFSPVPDMMFLVGMILRVLLENHTHHQFHSTQHQAHMQVFLLVYMKVLGEHTMALVDHIENGDSYCVTSRKIRWLN